MDKAQAEYNATAYEYDREIRLFESRLAANTSAIAAANKGYLSVQELFAILHTTSKPTVPTTPPNESNPSS